MTLIENLILILNVCSTIETDILITRGFFLIKLNQ